MEARPRALCGAALARRGARRREAESRDALLTTSLPICMTWPSCVMMDVLSIDILAGCLR